MEVKSSNLHGYIKGSKTLPTRTNPGPHAFRTKNFGLNDYPCQEQQLVEPSAPTWFAAYQNRFGAEVLE
jgi:hypothetical protein